MRDWIRPKYYEPTIRALIKISIKSGGEWVNDYWINRLLMLHKKASKSGSVRPRLTKQDMLNISQLIQNTNLDFLSNNERRAIQKILLLANRIKTGRETRGSYNW